MLIALAAETGDAPAAEEREVTLTPARMARMLKSRHDWWFCWLSRMLARRASGSKSAATGGSPSSGIGTLTRAAFPL